MATREPDDAEIDAAFASIVAGLQRDHPEPAGNETAERPRQERSRADALDDRWAREHPLFADEPDLEETEEVAEPPVWRGHRPPSDEELDDEPLPSSELPPWRPSAWAIAGIMAVAFSVVATLVVIAGVRTPAWLGWAALVGMAGGLVILFTRLPRNRDPDEDDGARL